MRKPSQIDEIRAYIETEGPTEVSRRTKLSRRTLQYITSGRYKPSYETLQKLLKEMGRVKISDAPGL